VAAVSELVSALALGSELVSVLALVLELELRSDLASLTALCLATETAWVIPGRGSN
jgi:hypothetical protein